MINLFVNYYVDSNPSRHREIESCFIHNANNRALNLIPILSQNRIKFSQYFEKVNQVTKSEDVNIICNSDIWFDASIELAQKIKPNQAYALSRWDLDGSGEYHHFDRSDSQDAWIFRGKIRNIHADFFMGFRGCDNRLAHEIQKAGYQLSNPSKSIRANHIQLSGARNYDMSGEFLVGGPYHQVHSS